MVFLEEGKPIHKYLPLLSTFEEYKEWELKQMEQHQQQMQMMAAQRAPSSGPSCVVM